jgi:hypothetical protein
MRELLHAGRTRVGLSVQYVSPAYIANSKWVRNRDIPCPLPPGIRGNPNGTEDDSGFGKLIHELPCCPFADQGRQIKLSLLRPKYRETILISSGKNWIDNSSIVPLTKSLSRGLEEHGADVLCGERHRAFGKGRMHEEHQASLA